MIAKVVYVLVTSMIGFFAVCACGCHCKSEKPVVGEAQTCPAKCPCCKCEKCDCCQKK